MIDLESLKNTQFQCPKELIDGVIEWFEKYYFTNDIGVTNYVLPYYWVCKHKENFHISVSETPNLRTITLQEFMDFKAKIDNWKSIQEQTIEFGVKKHEEVEKTIKSNLEKGLRFNQGKTRHDLVPAFAQEEYAKILTMGANKYSDRNWEKGMSWSNVIASMKRHLLEVEKGEDYDLESGCLHSAHIMCNAAFLTEYYKIYPQGDDRPHNYLKQFKIGLDIDEVLCNWLEGWQTKFGYETPNHWNFSYTNSDHFKSMTKEETKEFMLNLSSKIDGKTLPFEPHCYITARSVDTEITKEWLQNNGFPTVPVYSVGLHESKVEIARNSGIDIFVDDAFHNFVELNNAGICTYLLSAPHNMKYNVGHKRINSLQELADRLK